MSNAKRIVSAVEQSGFKSDVDEANAVQESILGKSATDGSADVEFGTDKSSTVKSVRKTSRRDLQDDEVISISCNDGDKNLERRQVYVFNNR